MQFIDIGANLTHQSFKNDFDQVVANAKQANVSHIILTGTDLPSSEATQLIASKSPEFFSSTVGFHPHIAESVTDDQLQLVKRDWTTIATIHQRQINYKYSNIIYSWQLNLKNRYSYINGTPMMTFSIF